MQPEYLILKGGLAWPGEDELAMGISMNIAFLGIGINCSVN